jgi:Zn-finger protein
MDRNKYNKSILNTEQGRCFVCGLSTETCRHEIFFGKGNRAISKKLGFWVNICPECHRKIHGDREMDLMLKKLAEMKYLETHDMSEFMDTKTGIGRNYLDE